MIFDIKLEKMQKDQSLVFIVVSNQIYYFLTPPLPLQQTGEVVYNLDELPHNYRIQNGSNN